MKKLIAITCGVGLVLGTSFAAMADVDVTATIDKTKVKEVNETVNIEKLHEVVVKQVVKPSNSAEAQAVKNDVNSGNTLNEEATQATPPEYAENEITQEQIEITPAVPAKVVEKNADLNDAFNGATGIINANQSPGSMNNQGNAVSVSYSSEGEEVAQIDEFGSEGFTKHVGGTFLHAESSADKELTGNTVNVVKSKRADTISGAFQDAAGIIDVNQSAGNINNQNNATALCVGLNSVAALSEADLGMVNSGNISTEQATLTTDTLTGGAFSAASGIINVSQSSGNMNNQANVVAVCAVTFP